MSSSQSWLSSYAYVGYSEKISRISALEIWQPYALLWEILGVTEFTVLQNLPRMLAQMV